MTVKKKTGGGSKPDVNKILERQLWAIGQETDRLIALIEAGDSLRPEDGLMLIRYAECTAKLKPSMEAALDAQYGSGSRRVDMSDDDLKTFLAGTIKSTNQV